MEPNTNTGLLCFLITARFFGVKVTKDIENRFINQENTYFELIKCAKELGLKVAAGKLKIKKIEKANVPVIAELKDKSYLLLINHQDNKWIVLNPLKGAPETIDEGILFEKLSGQVIILGKKKSGSDDNSYKKFGFSWFIPTILKYKKQFICVLVAVFFI